MLILFGKIVIYIQYIPASVESLVLDDSAERILQNMENHNGYMYTFDFTLAKKYIKCKYIMYCKYIIYCKYIMYCKYIL